MSYSWLCSDLGCGAAGLSCEVSVHRVIEEHGVLIEIIAGFVRAHTLCRSETPIWQLQNKVTVRFESKMILSLESTISLALSGFLPFST